MRANCSRGLAAACAVVALAGPGIRAQTANTTLDTSGTPMIIVNGVAVNFADAKPGTVHGQLLVPLRDVCKQDGATVIWDNDEKEVQICLPTKDTVTLETNDTWLAMQSVPQQRAERFADSKTGSTPTPFPLQKYEVVLIGNRAYMPFDQLAAALDGTATWDGKAPTATITAPTKSG